MEFGLHETLPIYSGGLGVLAGDYLKEASDLGLPLVGVGLMYAEGYFSQRISEDGWQESVNNLLNFEDLPVLQVLDDDDEPLAISVNFPDRVVTATYLGTAGRAACRSTCSIPTWMRMLPRPQPDLAPVLERPGPAHRPGNPARRGRCRALRALGYNPDVWHMNEGHAAFLTLERARELVAKGLTFEKAIAKTRHGNVFTTHTPVPAGNDEFPLWLVDKNLSNYWPELGLNRDQFVELACSHQPWGETFSMPDPGAAPVGWPECGFRAARACCPPHVEIPVARPSRTKTMFRSTM